MKSPSDAIKYAEGLLGVHDIFEETVEARVRLDKLLDELAKKRDDVRDKEFLLSDKEMEIAADERGKHADMSATAMEKHLKITFSNDGDVRGFREQIARIKSDIEGLEYDRSVCEHEIRIGCARMTELGGYFQYLAVIKAVANKMEVTNAGTVTSTTGSV